MSVRIIHGHVIDVLRTLEPESVHCIWTSVPYWGLRSYGTEPQVWQGADGCEHGWGEQVIERATNQTDKRRWQHTRNGRDEEQPTDKRVGWLRTDIAQDCFCQRCGAWRGEHGLEPALDMWLANEVTIWRELRRVLRKDGTAWLNCGDAYNAYNGGAGPSSGLSRGAQTQARPSLPTGFGLRSKSLKPKDRMMLPARLVIALQDDGWWLRDEIVWHKLNPMPSSVQDRTTPAHEMLYLLTKSARYYYDAKAIQEPMAESSVQRLSQPTIETQMGGAKQDAYESDGLNARSGSRRPNEIVKGLARKNERTNGEMPSARTGFNDRWDAKEAHRRLNNQDEKLIAGEKWGARHDGWKATAADREGRNKRSVWPLATEPYPGAHFATAPTALVEPCIMAGCPKGGMVLDPFGGSGTTGLVADRLGRNAILIELNPAYAADARERIKGDAPLFTEVG